MYPGGYPAATVALTIALSETDQVGGGQLQRTGRYSEFHSEDPWLEGFGFRVRRRKGLEVNLFVIDS